MHSFDLFTSDCPIPLNRPLIGLIRVSTPRQGEVGHSQEAQIAAINAFARQRGVVLLAIHGDVATGVGRRAHEDNKDLQEAVKHALNVGGILVVTSVSRLGRDPAVVKWLGLQGVDVIALDHGRVITRSELDRAVRQAKRAADQRRRQIIDGLKRAKARGVKLGNRKTLAKARRAASIKRMTLKDELTETIALKLRKHDPEGSMTAFEVAQLLNRLGIHTGQNLPWTQARVRRHLRAARGLLADGFD